MRRIFSSSLRVDLLFLLSPFLIYLPSVVVPSVFHPQVSPTQICERIPLCASWNTPWGVFTANFIWDGYQNLEFQLGFFVPIFIYYAIQKDVLKKEFSRYYVISIWVSDFLALFVSIAAHRHIASYGYSGVVYATAGIALTFPLIFIYNRIRELRRSKLLEMAARILPGFLPGLLFVGIGGYITLLLVVALLSFGYLLYNSYKKRGSPSNEIRVNKFDVWNCIAFIWALIVASMIGGHFFSIRPGVNYCLHELSFTFAIISGVLYVCFLSLRHLDNADAGQVQMKTSI